MSLIDSVINNFLFQNASANTAERNTDDSSTVRIGLPFKDQVAVNAVLKQLRNLSHKIGLYFAASFHEQEIGARS